MNSITQVMKFRRSMVEYALKHGVTKTAIKYNTYRQYVYRWLRRYDGSLESLRNKSRRPKHHPKAHTAAELKLIQDMRRRNPEAGLVVFWVKLRQRGYSRSITGLYRTLKRIGMTPVKPPNPKYVPKPYEQMLYPGQRIQIDVKFVPSALICTPFTGQLVKGDFLCAIPMNSKNIASTCIGKGNIRKHLKAFPKGVFA